ncbi:hypothetical protein H7I76_32165, partial [Mycolicibacterium vaccae]|nr:hypothetical protein [Mycolicibacterium vaccae]
AQPPITNTRVDKDRFRGWLLTARIIAYTAIALAALAFVFNLFWRIKAALPADSTGFGKQTFAIITTAIVYGSVALAAVVVASWWILQRSRASRLALVALGVSTLLAGLIVWLLPIGRVNRRVPRHRAEHRPAAAVGFEGFPGPGRRPLRRRTTHVAANRDERPRQRQHVAAGRAKSPAAHRTLECRIVLLRITDLAVTVLLNLPNPPYDNAAMAAFDLVTAVLAAWLHVNLTNRSLPVPVISSLCGVLFVFSVSRIVIGVAWRPASRAHPPGRAIRSTAMTLRNRSPAPSTSR